MNLIDFHNLINHIEHNYYSEIIMAVCEIISLVFAIKNVRTQKIGRLFILYISFDLLILIINWILLLLDFDQKPKSLFISFSNATIAWLELFVYYIFFFKVLVNYKIKILMKYLLSLFTILIICFFITKFNFISARHSYISNLLGAIEFIFILFPCFIFIDQILNTNSTHTLFDRPSFWIVTGIFFFALVSVPYYLIYTYIYKKTPLLYLLSSVLYYLPYGINFVFLTKAFSCKKTLTI